MPLIFPSQGSIIREPQQNVVVQYAETITGNDVDNTFLINHQLLTFDVAVTVYKLSTENIDVIVGVTRPTDNTVLIEFSAAPTLGTQYRVVVQKVTVNGSPAATITGDGTSTQFFITHNYGTRDVSVQVFRYIYPYSSVFVNSTRLDSNNIEIDFDEAPNLGDTYRVITIAGAEVQTDLVGTYWVADIPPPDHGTAINAIAKLLSNNGATPLTWT